MPIDNEKMRDKNLLLFNEPCYIARHTSLTHEYSRHIEQQAIYLVKTHLTLQMARLNSHNTLTTSIQYWYLS